MSYDAFYARAPHPTFRAQATPYKPTNLRATAGDGSITLTWDAGTNATRYRVFIRQDGGTWESTGGCPGTMTTQTTRTKTWSNLTNGTRYYVTVESLNDDGCSGKATAVSATPQAAQSDPEPDPTPPPSDTTPPPAPTNLRGSVSGDTVSLQWDAVNASDFLEYRIYANGGLASVATRTSDSIRMSDGAYRFTVRAKDLSGNESGDSNGVDLTVSTGAPPPDTSPPPSCSTGYSLGPNDQCRPTPPVLVYQSKTLITWNRSTLPASSFGSYDFKVRRDGGAWALVATITDQDQTSLELDWGDAPSGSYEYVAQTTDANGVQGGISNNLIIHHNAAGPDQCSDGMRWCESANECINVSGCCTTWCQEQYGNASCQDGPGGRQCRCDPGYVGSNGGPCVLAPDVTTQTMLYTPTIYRGEAFALEGYVRRNDTLDGIQGQPVTLEWAQCPGDQSTEQCFASSSSLQWRPAANATTGPTGAYRATATLPPTVPEGAAVLLRASYAGTSSAQSVDDAGVAALAHYYAQNHGHTEDGDGPIFVNCPLGQEWNRVRRRCETVKDEPDGAWLTWLAVLSLSGFLALRLHEGINKTGSLKGAFKHMLK